MVSTLEWAAQKWDNKYSLSWEVEYDRKKFHRALRNNFASGHKSNVDVEFTILDGDNERRLKGSICSVTSSKHGMMSAFRGYFEVRFNMLWERKNGKWDPYLSKDIVEVDFRDLVPENSKSETITHNFRGKWSDFVVLKIGWNQNITEDERFECGFTQFFWKLMTSTEFEAQVFGDGRPFGSDSIARDD